MWLVSRRLFMSAIVVLSVAVITIAWSVAANSQAERSSDFTPRDGESVSALADGTILIVGGESAGSVTNLSELVLPNSDVRGPHSIYARSGHVAITLKDGRILIAGGHDNVMSLDTTELFDPSVGAFVLGPRMNGERTGHTAHLLANGDVVLIGGDAKGTLEVFSAETQSFRLLPATLTSPRQNHSSIALKDGRILVVGGTDGNGRTLKSAEIFDPKTSITVAIGDMKSARKTPRLRLLIDGKVQVIGGNAGNPTLEMFNPQGYFTAQVNLPKSLIKSGLGTSTESFAQRGRARAVRVSDSAAHAGKAPSILSDATEPWVTRSRTRTGTSSTQMSRRPRTMRMRRFWLSPPERRRGLSRIRRLPMRRPRLRLLSPRSQTRSMRPLRLPGFKQTGTPRQTAERRHSHTRLRRRRRFLFQTFSLQSVVRSTVAGESVMVRHKLGIRAARQARVIRQLPSLSSIRRLTVLRSRTTRP